ncbi:tyrosine-type recombinase/integrase [Thalassotalea aquiviva]|uniref:tyrosine-type recombinase/integrase n=1 Tax=Thalassotalea aquiviva TaxID=3242415 RepID=UPI00352AFEAF
MATSKYKLKQGFTKDGSKELTLTATGIKALQPNCFIKDESNKGLRLNYNHNKTYSWIYHYRTKEGKKGQVKLGSYPALSIKEARDELSKFQKVRDQGGDPAQAKKDEIKKQSQKELTVADIVENFIEKHAIPKRNERSLIQTRSYLNNHIVKPLGKRIAKDISPWEWDDHLFTLATNSKSACKKVVTDIRKAYQLLIDNRKLDLIHNPIIFKANYTPDPAKQRALDDQELTYFFPWVERELSKNVKDALLLTLYTCARSGEIVQAKWSDINLETKTLLIPQENAEKVNYDRYIQLSEQAVEIIKSRIGLSKRYLFPSPKNTGTHLLQTSLSKPLREKAIASYNPPNAKNLKVKEWTPHDMRRTCRTGLSRLGCYQEIAEKIIGHTPDKKIVTVYDKEHRYDEQRQWLQKWADHLDTLRGEQ